MVHRHWREMQPFNLKSSLKVTHHLKIAVLVQHALRDLSVIAELGLLVQCLAANNGKTGTKVGSWTEAESIFTEQSLTMKVRLACILSKINKNKYGFGRGLVTRRKPRPQTSGKARIMGAGFLAPRIDR